MLFSRVICRNVLIDMKRIATISLILCPTILAIAQKPDADALLNEGKMLYRLERAAWYATDHLLASFPNKRDSIGGYLSYEGSDGQIYSIFFDRTNNYRILARYRFNSDPTQTPNDVDTTGSSPIGNESELIAVRQTALDMIYSDDKEFFTFYENTSFNIVPLINENIRKVYILTAPQKEGVVLIGNDYLLEYNSKNKLINRKKLHKSLIELPYKPQSGQKVIATMHTHVLSNHIEPTDICTLLLYKDSVEWSQHYVINQDYVSIFDLEKETLVIMTKKDFDNINSNDRR